MYRARPESGCEQIVFDYALRSRLAGLADVSGAVVLICDSMKTVESFARFEAEFPQVKMGAIVVNPGVREGKVSDTAQKLGWEKPEQWRPYAMTDRWARIETALEIGASMKGAGYLVMPAHDAVWGKGLLAKLAYFSQKHAKGGFPAAVSSYTYHQHSAVPGVDIPQAVIGVLNTAFGRDTLFGWKIQRDQVQGFWGKMGMLPYAMCATVNQKAEKIALEDDLEIDRVIREAGYGVRALYVRRPQLYRQALPVFDREGLRKVIERTLHYSLNIPSDPLGSSSLNVPLDNLGRIRQILNPVFAHYNTEAEKLIDDCMKEIKARIDRWGASWVDWGAYRYVIRVGDPATEVWGLDAAIP